MSDSVDPATVSVIGVRVLSRYFLEFTFGNGEVRVIDFERLMWAPAFEPLLTNYRLFCDVGVDPRAGTITWPGIGPDWSAQELYEKSKPAVPRRPG